MNLIRSFSLFIVLLAGLFPASLTVGAESQEFLIQKGAQHLEAWRVPEAAEVISQLTRESPKTLDVLDLQAQLAFYQGNMQRPSVLQRRP